MLEDSDLDFYSPGPGDDKDSDDDDLQDDTDDLEEEIHVTQFNGTINKSEWNFTEKMWFFYKFKISQWSQQFIWKLEIYLRN